MLNMQDCDRVLENWREFRLKSREGDLSKAEYFNVFKVLDVHHAETRLHSPFLVDLFRSDGLHAQGTLFVKAFLGQFINPKQLPTYVQGKFDDSYTCREEVADKDSGRMDILIERLTGPSEERFCIVVENKIGAGEQQAQLDRYWQYLEGQQGVSPERKFLVYLHAKDGDHKPISGSNVPKGRLIELRHQDHMVRVFRECLGKIEAPKVREVVAQYMAVIEQIGADMTEMPRKEVFDFLTKPDRWECVLEIAREMEKIKPKVRRDFFEAVMEKLPKPRFSFSEYWPKKTDKEEIKQLALNVDGWGKSVRLCLGKYPDWYFGIEGKWNDSRADLVKRVLDRDGNGLNAYAGESGYEWWQRTIKWHPTSDPFNWPQGGHEAMQKLAEKIGKLMQEKLVKPFDQQISETGR